MSRFGRGIRSWAMFVVLLEVAAGVLGVVVMGFLVFVATGQRFVPLRKLGAMRIEAAQRQLHRAR